MIYAAYPPVVWDPFMLLKMTEGGATKFFPNPSEISCFA